MPFENKDLGYDERKKALATNLMIRTPLPRLSKNIGRKKTGGRVKKFTPTRMRNAINRYFKRCEDRDEMPTIKGLMIFLDMDQSQFYQYLKYPEFTDMMEHTRLIISNWAEEVVFKCEGRTEGKIAYMKNVHSWTDKIEQKTENINLQLTPEQARARIEALAPKLLEVLKNQNVVNQIPGKVEDADYEEVKQVTR